MRQRATLVIAGLALMLVTASLAAGLLIEPDGQETSHDATLDVARSMGPAPDPGPSAQAASHDNASGDVPGPPLEPAEPSHRHFRSGQPGTVPTRAEASELEHQLRSFTVVGDDGLATMAKDGYLTGTGSTSDPYLIDGFRVREDLTIRDTSKALVIRNSFIEGQLTLNYVDEDVYVHHNRIYDLRVNENVDRRGDTTAGLFEHNEISFIGQLRHFGGEFTANQVGPKPDGVATQFLSDTGPKPLPEDLVWNFDGYHGALVHANEVVGRVDVKLHGHFHASCNACPAHDHADPAGFPEGNERVEGAPPGSTHAYRYHTLVFRDNDIRLEQPGPALRFNDEAHAGDDQTANSEPNAYLEDRHDHHQYLAIQDNRITGGSLVLDIVNAEDDRHADRVTEALVHLTGNQVTLVQPRGEGTGLTSAYTVHQAHTLELVATGNAFAFESEGSPLPDGTRWTVDGEPAETTGFLLAGVDLSSVSVQATRGEGASYGVSLHQVTDRTHLELSENDFQARDEEVHHA